MKKVDLSRVSKNDLLAELRARGWLVTLKTAKPAGQQKAIVRSAIPRIYAALAAALAPMFGPPRK